MSESSIRTSPVFNRHLPNLLEEILVEPDKIMDKLSKELDNALKAMAKAKDLNEKESHSRIVKNLCESLGVFFDLASDMMPFEDDEFEEVD